VIRVPRFGSKFPCVKIRAPDGLVPDTEEPTLRVPQLHVRRLIAALTVTALASFIGACGDDDDVASDHKTTTTERSNGGTDDGSSTTQDTAPLSPDDAREAGNPEVYDRIASETDCAELQRERDTAKANAENRKDDPRRQSILESYADAAQDRMDEQHCPSS
jgi:hypothetical protein